MLNREERPVSVAVWRTELLRMSQMPELRNEVLQPAPDEAHHASTEAADAEKPSHACNPVPCMPRPHGLALTEFGIEAAQPKPDL